MTGGHRLPPTPCEGGERISSYVRHPTSTLQLRLQAVCRTRFAILGVPRSYEQGPTHKNLLEWSENIRYIWGRGPEYRTPIFHRLQELHIQLTTSHV